MIRVGAGYPAQANIGSHMQHLHDTGYTLMSMCKERSSIYTSRYQRIIPQGVHGFFMACTFSDAY
jgi:hypothetical protein